MNKSSAKTKKAASSDTVEELRELLSDSESALSSFGDKADGKVADLIARLKSSVEDIGPKLEEWRDEAKEKVKECDKYAHEHPYHIAGGAALVGVLVGLLVSRLTK